MIRKQYKKVFLRPLIFILTIVIVFGVIQNGSAPFYAESNALNTSMPAIENESDSEEEDVTTDTVIDSTENEDEEVSKQPEKDSPQNKKQIKTQGSIQPMDVVQAGTFAELQSQIAGATGARTINITGNIPFNGTISIPNNSKITLVSNNTSVNRVFTSTSTLVRHFIVTDNSSLTLKSTIILDGNSQGGGIEIGGYPSDLILDGATIRNCSALRGGAIGSYYKNANITLNNAKIDNCSAVFLNSGDPNQDYLTGNGGAVHTVSNGGNMNLIINGGTISNCKADREGGGVYSNEPNNSTTISNNATFMNCTAETGGATFMGSNTVNSYNNVKIEGCKATSNGGGLFLKGNIASLSVDSIDIDDCVATQNGGGIYNEGKSITLTNTNINNCTANAGGGVFITTDGQVILDGGTIKESKAMGDGGAVFSSGVLIINGNQISSCSAVYGNGGAVDSSGTLTINNISIKNCSSAWNGGGIRSSGFITALNNMTIDNCRTGSNTGNNGGFISITGNNVNNFTINNSTIKNCNTPVGNGGFLFINGDNNNVSLNNTVIETCEAGEDGGAMFLNGVNNYISLNSGTTIKGCTAGKLGGGIYNPTVNVGIDGGDIEQCNAITGGGIYNEWGSASLTLTNAGIKSCTATDSGGGIYINDTPTNINGGSIEGCSAGTNGGGIYMDSATTNINNSSIKNCTAQLDGGGVYTTAYNMLNIDSSTSFSGNDARYYRQPAQKVSIDHPNINSSSISLTSSELAIMHPLNNYDVYYQSYSIICDATSGSAVVGTSPYTLTFEFNPDWQYVSVFYNNTDYFDFQLSGADFSHWNTTSNNNGISYFPESDAHIPDFIGNMNTTSQPSATWYAQWEADLELEKKVSGDFANLTRSFNVQVNLVSSTGAAISGTFDTTGSSITPITFTNGVANLTLKDKESIKLLDIPITHKYTITELSPSPFNVLYYKNDNSTPISVSDLTLGENTKITIANDYNNVIPTGNNIFNLNMLLYMAILLLAGLILYNYRSKKKDLNL